MKPPLAPADPQAEASAAEPHAPTEVAAPQALSEDVYTIELPQAVALGSGTDPP